MMLDGSILMSSLEEGRVTLFMFVSDVTLQTEEQ